MKKYILLLLMVSVMIACQENQVFNLPVSANEITKTAQKSFEETPAPLSANNYVKTLITELGNKKTTDADKKSIMLEGLRVCEEYNLNGKSLNFLYPLVKNYSDEKETNDRLYKMADVMHKLKKNEGANIIFHSLKDRDAKYADGVSKMTEEINNIEAYIDTLGARLFVDPNTNGVNKSASQNYVDACESFTLANADSKLAPAYLFKAAEIARTIRTFPKVMSLYDWISDKYPNYEKTPTVLFLKGFVLENDLKSTEAAKKAYEEFLAKYPTHELADDVGFLLEHIGKSDEEILKIIEAKKNNQ